MYKYLIKLHFPIILLLLLSNCTSNQPAEIVHLGEKFYGYEEFVDGDKNIAREVINKPKAHTFIYQTQNNNLDRERRPTLHETSQNDIKTQKEEIQVQELSPTNSDTVKIEKSEPNLSSDSSTKSSQDSVKIVKLEDNLRKDTNDASIKDDSEIEQNNQIEKNHKNSGINTENKKYIWPVEGNVISTFGSKGKGIKNDGINIESKEGTKIKAISSGEVLYAGNELRGYGNLLIIKQSDGTLVAYAHQKNILVKKGDKVAQGQTIGYVGSTGNVSTPQLHLAIRKNKKPVNPLSYLQ